MHQRDITRIQVTVGGYTWRVHGAPAGRLWQCHLVELVGPLPLDRTISDDLRDQLRWALAKALRMDEDAVAQIPADLILA